MTKSNQRIGDENKQTKEYIFFSGTKIRILFEYNNFLFFLCYFPINVKKFRVFLFSVKETIIKQKRKLISELPFL